MSPRARRLLSSTAFVVALHLAVDGSIAPVSAEVPPVIDAGQIEAAQRQKLRGQNGLASGTNGDASLPTSDALVPAFESRPLDAVEIGERQAAGWLSAPARRMAAGEGGQAVLSVRIGEEYLGPDYSQPNTPIEFLYVELLLTHELESEAESFTLDGPAMQLVVDGQSQPLPESLAESVGQNTFHWMGNLSRVVDRFHAAEVVTLRRGESVRLTLVFEGLPRQARVPSLQLTWPGLSQPVDLRGLADERMELSSTRLGPRRSLALVALRGPVDTVAAGGLADHLQTLAGQGVRRVILSFEPGEAALGGTVTDYQLMQWLVNATATSSSREARFPTHPRLPASFSELHLLQTGDQLTPWLDEIFAGSSEIENVHDTRSAAIEAALLSGLARLGRSPLLQLVRTADEPAVRAAALRAAAETLAPGDEPLLAGLLEDESEALRAAAIEALGQLTTDSSLDRLVAIASRTAARESERNIGDRNNGDRDSSLLDEADLAVEALLSSAADRRNRALRRLPLAALTRPRAFELLRPMADPIDSAADRLAEVFREVFRDDGGQRSTGENGPADAPVPPPAETSSLPFASGTSPFGPSVPPATQRRIEALEGLVALNVADLLELLDEARRDESEEVRAAALRLLSRSADATLRQRAREEARHDLAEGELTRDLLQLAGSIGDRQMADAIVRRLPAQSGPLAGPMLEALSQIGSQQQWTEAASHYDDLEPPVQQEMLKRLAQRRIPIVYTLASDELMQPREESAPQHEAAARAMQVIGTSQARDVLLDALRQEVRRLEATPDVQQRVERLLSAFETLGDHTVMRALSRFYRTPATADVLRTPLVEAILQIESNLPAADQLRSAMEDANTVEMLQEEIRTLRAEVEDASLAAGDEDTEDEPDDADERRSREMKAQRLARLLKQVETSWDEAIAGYSLAIRIDPFSARAFHGRGYARLSLEDYEAAVADFQTAIDLGTYERDSWVMKAIAEMTLGRLQDARRTLDQASDLGGLAENEHIYRYNVACAYGRARQALLEPTSDEVRTLSPADRTRLLADVTDAAFQELERSVRLTAAESHRLASLNPIYLQNDPDLASLRSLPQWPAVLALFTAERSSGDDAAGPREAPATNQPGDDPFNAPPRRERPPVQAAPLGVEQ